MFDRRSISLYTHTHLQFLSFALLTVSMSKYSKSNANTGHINMQCVCSA